MPPCPKRGYGKRPSTKLLELLRAVPAVDHVPVSDLVVNLDAPRILIGPCGSDPKIVILKALVWWAEESRARYSWKRS